MATATALARPVSPAPDVTSPWVTFGVASIAVFLVSIDATVLYAAFPALRVAFPGASAGALSWVLNAYTVVYAALLVPAGRLADLRGRKRMFLIGVAIFLLASLGCGLSGSVGMLIAARAVQAIGAALLLPASLAIVLAAFPTSKRAIVVSLWGAVSGLAAAIGPSVGSLLVERFGWPWAFYVNLPLGAISLVRGARLLRESRNPDNGAPLDLVGVALLVTGVGAIALGLVRSEALGWSSWQIPATVIAGLVALGLFVVWARRAPSPAIDLALFENRTYRFVNLATLIYGVAFAMMFLTFFLFMTGVWHVSLAHAGLAVTPGPLLVVPSSIISGRLAARIGHRPLLIGGGLLFAGGALWYLLVPQAQPDYLHVWLPGLIMTGIANGMVMPSLSGAAAARLPLHQLGIGSAANQAIRQVGSVIGVALTVALVGRAALTMSAFHTLCGLQIALALATAALCLPVDTHPLKLGGRRALAVVDGAGH